MGNEGRLPYGGRPYRIGSFRRMSNDLPARRLLISFYNVDPLFLTHMLKSPEEDQKIIRASDYGRALF